MHVGTKPSENTERCIIASEDWDGYADNTIFKENIFYAVQPSEFRLTKSTRNTFAGNYYLGVFKSMPADAEKHSESKLYESLIMKEQDGILNLMEKIEIANGEASVTIVNKKAIGDFFIKMKKGNN